LGEEGNGSSDAEVNYLNLFLFRVNQKYILKLKIPMNQIVLMTVLHPLYDLPEKYLSRFFIQPSLFFNILQKFSAL
jgi:hypothetical protein